MHLDVSEFWLSNPLNVSLGKMLVVSVFHTLCEMQQYAFLRLQVSRKLVHLRCVIM